MKASILLFAVVFSTAAHAHIISTFDTGADAWVSVGNGAEAITWSSTSGNPPGVVSITDVDNGWAYFQAPGQFLVPGSYGQTLSFDLSVSVTGLSPSRIKYPVQVALEGNGLTLLNGLAFPTGFFVNYLFTLDETTGWRIVTSRNSVYSPGSGTAPTQAWRASEQAGPGHVV